MKHISLVILDKNTILRTNIDYLISVESVIKLLLTL